MLLRILIIGIPIYVVVMIYAVVDCAMIQQSRIRGLSRPAWIVLIIVGVVIGPVLWFTIGRSPAGKVRRPRTLDDAIGPLDGMSQQEHDQRIRDLEAQLLALDAEEQAAAEEAARRDSTSARTAGASSDAGEPPAHNPSAQDQPSQERPVQDQAARERAAEDGGVHDGDAQDGVADEADAQDGDAQDGGARDAGAAGTANPNGHAGADDCTESERSNGTQKRQRPETGRGDVDPEEGSGPAHA